MTGPLAALLGALALLVTQQVLTGGRTGQLERVTFEPSDRVSIPSGEFTMGSTQRDLSYAVALCQLDVSRQCNPENFRAEGPSHKVRTRGYSIGRTEVSNADFERCVRLGACQPRVRHRPDPRLDAPNLPVVDVTWLDAQAFCRWQGGRLPTEAEWERAARGQGGRRFSWGILWNGALCNHGQASLPYHDDSDGFRHAAPVDAFGASRSPQGLLNTAGNVWEWVADWFAEETYQRGAYVADPEGPAFGQLRVIRGGSWASPAFAQRATTRGRAAETERSIDIGFRCAWSE